MHNLLSIRLSEKKNDGKVNNSNNLLMIMRDQPRSIEKKNNEYDQRTSINTYMNPNGNPQQLLTYNE